MRISKKERRRLLRKQKLMGLAMLAICAVMLALCCTGITPEDRDATGVVMLAPLALWLIFSKKILIYG